MKMMHNLLGGLAAGGLLQYAPLAPEGVLAALLAYAVSGAVSMESVETLQASEEGRRWSKRAWSEVVRARKEIQTDLELSVEGKARLDEVLAFLEDASGRDDEVSATLSQLIEHQVSLGRVTAKVPAETARLVRAEQEVFEGNVLEALTSILKRVEREEGQSATRLELHICENLNYGCVTVSAYPVGTEAVQVVDVRVLYQDGSETFEEKLMPYPVVLDPMRPPKYADLNGPWEDLCHIPPPHFMRTAKEHGGVRGLVVELSDGREERMLGPTIEDKLVLCAVKALREWLK